MDQDTGQLNTDAERHHWRSAYIAGFTVLWLLPLVWFFMAVLTDPGQPSPWHPTVLLLATFAMGGLVFALPEYYFHISHPQASRHFYEKLAIREVKKFVLDGDRMNSVIRKHDRSYKVVHCERSARAYQ